MPPRVRPLVARARPHVTSLGAVGLASRERCGCAWAPPVIFCSTAAGSVASAPLPSSRRRGGARYLTAYTEGDNAADASDYAPARSREPVDCYDLDADEGGSYGDDYSDVGRCARSARTGRGTARRCCQDGGCAAAATLAAWMLEVELARAAVAVAAAQRGRRTASFAPTQSPR